MDDEPAVRTIVRMLIERHPGFELVVEAGDVAAALEPLRTHRPDVVLLDLLLPGGSGVDALDEVTASAPDAMVVILSALSAVDEAQRAFEAGAFAYLEKSVLGPSLLREITELRDLYVRAEEGVAVWEAPDGPPRIRR